jgi:uncharacterized membrane protein
LGYAVVKHRQPEVNTMENTPTYTAVSDKQKNLVLLVYILQALSFLVGVSAIAGIIINYLKRDEVKGTWLESHFDWQIKTFWYTLLGSIIGFVLLIIGIGVLILGAVTLWYIYRVIKGWLAYNDAKTLPDGLF